jgi:galactose-1-phosphate uridylyltransferase
MVGINMPEKQITKESIQGKGNIIFEKEIREAKIRSPLQSFEEVKQKIEYRKDPITNHYSRINKLRAERVKQAASPGEDYLSNLQQLIEKSGRKCFFCEENVTKSTPKFAEELAVGDRIIQNDFVLVPNLFVFAESHAVGILGKNHFTELNAFTEQIWEDALKGSIKYFKAVFANDKLIRYPTINFNYLPPSASSIVHPHIQIIQDIQPTKIVDTMLKQSMKYKEVNQSNIWLDLIASEKELNERFIAENDFICWLASYAPQGKNEIQGILKVPKSDITQLSSEEQKKLADEIVKALKALYEIRGARSVNMSIFSGPINEDDSESFRINVKIVTRPALSPNYTGDRGFLELLHLETVAEATPEMIAETLKGKL